MTDLDLAIAALYLRAHGFNVVYPDRPTVPAQTIGRLMASLTNCCKEVGEIQEFRARTLAARER